MSDDDREIISYAVTDDGLDAIINVTRQCIAMDRPHTTAEIRDELVAVIERQLDHYNVEDERKRLALISDMLAALLATAVQRLAQEQT
jgi:hypothetical protein